MAEGMGRPVNSTSRGPWLQFFGCGVNSSVRSSALWNLLRHARSHDGSFGKNTAWRRNKFTFMKEEIWHKPPATKEQADCPSQRYHWRRSIALCCQQKEYSAAATLNAAFATAGQLLSLMHSHHPCHQFLISLARLGVGVEGKRQAPTYWSTLPCPSLMMSSFGACSYRKQVFSF